MHVFRAIFKRELKSYFSTPLGYVFIVVFLIGANYLAFEPGKGNFFESRQAHLLPLFQFMPYMFVFLVPAIAMRLWAEERRSGTAELLFTMPVKVGHAVMAKFLAAWAVVLIALACTGTLLATTLYLATPGNPDWGPIITGYLASFLLAGLYLAVGCFCSALSKNQVIAFILAVIACVLLLIAGSPPVLDLVHTFVPSSFVVDFVETLSLQSHFESMLRGVLELRDLVFFIALIAAWLAASGIVLDHQKAK